MKAALTTFLLRCLGGCALFGLAMLLGFCLFCPVAHAQAQVQAPVPSAADGASLQAAMSGGIDASYAAAAAAGIDPAIQQAINAAVGPQYTAQVTAVLSLLGLVVFALGRYNKARKNGLSGWDAMLAVLEGSNVPLVALCACMLALSSCAQWTKFISSPQGQATVKLADLGLDVLAATGEIPPGSNIVIKNGLAVITDPNKPGVQKTVELETLGLDAAVDAGKIKEGDKILIQQATAIIQSAVPVTSAKAPKDVQAK